MAKKHGKLQELSKKKRETYMSRHLLLVTAALLATSVSAAREAQTAAEFCAEYETTCKAIGTNFANTAACETFYTGAALKAPSATRSPTPPAVPRRRATSTT